MKYLMFNKDVLIGDGQYAHWIEKGEVSREILGSQEEAIICVVDVDLLIAASVEDPIEKKDSILVRKFKEFYQHEAYVIQDEKIENNLFQVMGIKEQKVREIFSIIPSNKVTNFIPYGIALRNTLIEQKIDFTKTIVFLDDLGPERLLTVFDGLKFSRTRVIDNSNEDILSEIKRSKIDFFKKNEEFINAKKTEFIIVLNSQVLAEEISNSTEKLKVQYLNIKYPALEGLRISNAQFKYRLPEEIIKERNESNLRKKRKTWVLSVVGFLIGLSFFLYYSVESNIVNDQYHLIKFAHLRLDEQIRTLDKGIYRSDLSSHKSLNYGISYLEVLEAIPVNYLIKTFKFYKTNKWRLEITLLSDGKGLLEPIPRATILKDAEIKDIFVNNQPGKLLRLTL